MDAQKIKERYNVAMAITVFLRGGLGNQMFQYAAGLHIAKKNSAPLFLDTTFLNDRFPRKEFTYRTFDLDIFALSPSQISLGEIWEGKPRFTALSGISKTIPVPGFWLGLDLILMKIQDMLGIRRVVKEKKETHSNTREFSEKGNIVLYGRWQSERYFIDNADDVRNSFRFRRSLSGEAVALAEQIQNSNSVSLHVRRGDYVNFERNTKLFGETDISYYKNAIAYIGERVDKPHFFVFSDDIAWCRENIKIPFPVKYLDEKTAGPKNAFHLELMSLCKHNVITNSSFSWWGAWLNRNPKKIVIAPKRWHIDAEQDDIVPDGWIRV